MSKPTGVGEVPIGVWKQVAAINMQARQQASAGSVPSSAYQTIASLPSVGYSSSGRAVRPKSQKRHRDSDVIVLSDEENSPNSKSGRAALKKATNHTHLSVLTIAEAGKEEGEEESGSDVHALRELLQQEEQKLTMLKQMHDMQQQGPGSSGKGEGEHSVGSKSRSGSSKPNIVVVPGNQKISVARETTSGSVISTRLQQLVDSVAVNQALNTQHLNSTSRLAKSVSVRTTTSHSSLSKYKLPVPSLKTDPPSSSKPSSQTLAIVNQTLSQISAGCAPPNRPNLGPSIMSIPSTGDVITITDSPSPVSKAPPPLLPSSVVSSSVSALLDGHISSIQVPTISSTMVAGSESKENNSSKERALQRAVESSKRYKDYLMKHSHAKRSFQKQMERKISIAPYPKTFRQVWPVIPVHDPAFVRNFGLEAVFVHLDPNWKALHDKSSSSSKVKPICNQCGCDFASAWQIRKSNSKQLLLCEACDFTNLKILQRSKLSTQLKELIDSIKKEDDRFATECEEARKQVVALERQALKTYQSHRPPPLTSQLAQLHAGSVLSAATHVIQAANSNQAFTVVSNSKGGAYNPSKGIISMALKSSSEHPRATIPPVTSHQQRSKDIMNGSHAGSRLSQARDTKKAPANTSSASSRTLKLGSTLDQTLSRLSEQLLKRKLDEHRQEQQQLQVAEDESMEQARSESPPSPSADSRRRRKQGRPKHKRHLSSSSATGE